MNTIHLPLACFFLLERERTTYADLWRYLRAVCNALGHQFFPNAFRLELEQPVARAAFAEVFPRCNVYVSGDRLLTVWYQRLRRYIPDDELRHLYGRSDAETALWLSGIFGLPYVPVDRVADAFDELVAATPALHQRRLMPFFRYVRKTFVSPDAPYPATDWADRGQRATPRRTVFGPGSLAAIFDQFRVTLWSRWDDATAFLLCALLMQKHVCVRAIQVEHDIAMEYDEYRHDSRTEKKRRLAVTAWELHNAGRMSLLDYVQLMGNENI